MGKRAWLESQLNEQILPILAQLSPEGGKEKASLINQALRDSWAQRGFSKLSQQQPLMDRTRRVIKDHLGETHFSLDYIKLTTDEYIELNNLKQGNVQERNEEVKYLEDPNAIVQKAVELLSSPEWSDVAAGLAVVTGRRSSEILSTAKFEFYTEWSVIFTGALKRRGETQTLSFEIPTLAPSKDVIKALEYVRTALLDAAVMDAAKVNQKYGPSVARSCDRHFEGLVPYRVGKDNLYTHLFRAVYATIATFWYCPPNVNDIEFKATIQGHYFILDESDEERRRNVASSRHYSDYEIADAVIARYNGKRRGVRLSEPGVSIIDPFKKTSLKDETKQKKSFSTVRVFKDDKDLLFLIFQRLGLDEQLNQPQRFYKFLQWALQAISEPTSVIEPSADYSKDNSSTEVREIAQLPSITENTSVDPFVLPQSPETLPQQEEESPPPNNLREEEQDIKEELSSTEQPAVLAQCETPVLAQCETPTSIKKPNTTDELAAPADSTGLESKLDKLLDVMTQFVNLQIAQQPNLNNSNSTAPNKNEQPKSKKKIEDPSSLGTSEQSNSTRSRKHHNTENAAVAINCAIDRIIAHNNTPGLLHDLKWAITINAVKELVSDVTKSQRLVQKIINERSAFIEQHHHKHSLNPTLHNHRHKRKQKITDVIKPVNRDGSLKQSNSPLLSLANQFIDDDDVWCKLTGVIALTGQAPDDLLKHFVYKEVLDEHTILYTRLVHPSDAPYLQLITLVDAAKVMDAIATLKTHPHLKPYLDTHTGQQINAYVRERIADYLGQLGVETYQLAIEQYQEINQAQQHF